MIGQYVGNANIPSGTTVTSISQSATILVETGDLTAGSSSLSGISSSAGLGVNDYISGIGIPSGTQILSISGTGPYTVVMSNNSFQTGTGITVTFSSAPSLTLSANATANITAATLVFYLGAQVAYQAVFGRVDTDENGNTTTRLGSPSAVAIATNLLVIPRYNDYFYASKGYVRHSVCPNLSICPEYRF